MLKLQKNIQSPKGTFKISNFDNTNKLTRSFFNSI